MSVIQKPKKILPKKKKDKVKESPKKKDKVKESPNKTKEKDDEEKDDEEKEDEHGFEETKDMCVWTIDGTCSCKKFEATIFKGQLKIPICEKHLKNHRNIMTLRSSGKDIDKVINATSEEIEDFIKRHDIKLVPWDKI